MNGWIKEKTPENKKRKSREEIEKEIKIIQNREKKKLEEN